MGHPVCFETAGFEATMATRFLRYTSIDALIFLLLPHAIFSGEAKKEQEGTARFLAARFAYSRGGSVWSALMDGEAALAFCAVGAPAINFVQFGTVPQGPFAKLIEGTDESAPERRQ